MIKKITFFFCILLTSWFVYDEFFSGSSVLKIAHFKKKLIPIYSLDNALVLNVNIDTHDSVPENTLLLKLDSSKVSEEISSLISETLSLEKSIQFKQHILEVEKGKIRTYENETNLISLEMTDLTKKLDNLQNLYSNNFVDEQAVLAIESKIRDQKIDLQQSIRGKQESLQRIADLNEGLENAGRSILKNSERVKYLKNEMRKYDIRMPQAVEVKEVFVQPGQMIREGDLLAVLLSQENYWIEANIKESNLSNIKLGASVQVEIDSYKKLTYKGIVRSIAPATEAEVSRTGLGHLPNYRKYQQRLIVKIELDDPDGSLSHFSSGLSATVYL